MLLRSLRFVDQFKLYNCPAPSPLSQLQSKKEKDDISKRTLERMNARSNKYDCIRMNQLQSGINILLFTTKTSQECETALTLQF